MNKKIFSLDELKKLAKGLSHYGDMDMDLYTGADDESLEFGSPAAARQGFALDDASLRPFSFTLQNNHSAALRLKIFDGYNVDQPKVISLTTASVTNVRESIIASHLSNGQLRDGFIPDLDNLRTDPTAAGLTATASSIKPINEFVRYVLWNPTRVVGMGLKSNNNLQMDQPFIIAKLDPFKRTETVEIRPDSKQDQGVFQDKILKFPVQDLQIDSLTEVTYTVLPLTSITITLYCGPTLSLAKALQSKANRAFRNIASQGLTNVRRQAAIGLPASK